MKINRYEDISQIEREAKKDYIDRHSPFIHCADQAVSGKVLPVRVKVGDAYVHPDEHDHYIAWVQLWNGEKMLAQTSFTAGGLGNLPGHIEVEFNIVPTANMKLMAMSFCTKHGLWQSAEKMVEVAA
jgi:superoxide reductase